MKTDYDGALSRRFKGRLGKYTNLVNPWSGGKTLVGVGFDGDDVLGGGSRYRVARDLSYRPRYLVVAGFILGFVALLAPHRACIDLWRLRSGSGNLCHLGTEPRHHLAFRAPW